MTLGTYLNQWLSVYCSNLRPNSRACYARSIRALPPELLALDLGPGFGASELLTLSAWLVERSASVPRAAGLDRVMLSRSLTRAQALGLVPAAINVAGALPQIRHTPAETVTLSADQFARLIHRLYTLAPFSPAACALLLCCCGLRLGEALGALRQNLVGSTLEITCQQGFLPLKSRAAHRFINLPEEVVKSLLLLGGETDQLCPASRGQVYRLLHALREELRLPEVTPHGLRHTVATLAALDGVSIHAIKRMLGHSHISITSDLYAQHQPEAPSPVLDLLPPFRSA